ncbi:MAG TPA: hypothetical protein DCS93_42010 [Microscillaceae bacterium]|nr:hypothetical protein [Microscillaceae bacterium]
MAEFRHIIGAMLKNITQARQQSDKYTQEVAQKYRKEEALQLFPIPSATVDSLQLQVNFMMKPTQVAQSITVAHIDAVRDLFRSYAVLISGQWFDFIKNLSQEITHNRFAQLSQTSTSTLAEVQQAILDFLNQNIYSIIEYATIDKPLPHPTHSENLPGYLLGVVLEILRKKVYTLEDGVATWWNAYPNVIQDLENSSLTTQAQENVKDTIEFLVTDIQLVFSQTTVSTLSMITEEDKLKSFDQGAVSSITIDTNIRNYMWSEATGDDGSITETLIPE